MEDNIGKIPDVVLGGEIIEVLKDMRAQIHASIQIYGHVCLVGVRDEMDKVINRLEDRDE